MKTSFFYILVITVFVCAFTTSGKADSPALPRDPEVPWEGDPDIKALKDERLKQIWEDVVKEYRRVNPFASPAFSMWREPLPKDAETQEYLITSLNKTLHAEKIDWNSVYTMVLLMLGGMEADPRIPELARYIYQLPRPMKMSAAHAGAYAQMYRVLQLQQSVEAAAVLYDAVDKTFWGNDPYHDRPKRSTNEAILRKREIALSILGEMLPSISIPFLEKLAKEYPYTPQENEKHVIPESEFEEWIKQNPDGSIPKNIRTILKRVYEKRDKQNNALSDSQKNE